MPRDLSPSKQAPSITRKTLTLPGRPESPKPPRIAACAAPAAPPAWSAAFLADLNRLRAMTHRPISRLPLRRRILARVMDRSLKWKAPGDDPSAVAAEARAVLERVCGSREYLEAVIAAEQRFTLAGLPAPAPHGVVSDQHREHARLQLAKLIVKNGGAS